MQHLKHSESPSSAALHTTLWSCFPVCCLSCLPLAVPTSHLLPQPAEEEGRPYRSGARPTSDGWYLHCLLVRTAFRWEKTVVPKVNSTDKASTLSVEASSYYPWLGPLALSIRRPRKLHGTASSADGCPPTTLQYLRAFTFAVLDATPLHRFGPPFSFFTLFGFSLD